MTTRQRTVKPCAAAQRDWVQTVSALLGHKHEDTSDRELFTVAYLYERKNNP